MAGPSEIPFLPAVGIAGAVRSGRLRAEEVVAAFLARIGRLHPRVRAIAHLDPAGALRQARAADRAVAAGLPTGPLHGVPMTVKDSFRVAASPSSFGLPYLRLYRPAADCEAAARLRRAGAVILGRTAVPFACFDWQCRPPLRRECVNPLDPSRTPGGSSGGAAAALAARLTPLELGTDVAGSLRYPAHCCGVFALRTTVGPMARRRTAARRAAGGRSRACSRSVRWPGRPTTSPSSSARCCPARTRGRSARRPGPGCGSRSRRRSTGSRPSRPPPPRWKGSPAGWGRPATRSPSSTDRPSSSRRPTPCGACSPGTSSSALPPGLRGRLAVRAFAAWFLDYQLGPGPLAAFMRRGLLAPEGEYRDGLARREDLARTLDRFFDGYDLWALPVSPAAAIRRQRAGRPLPLGGGRVPYSRFLGAYLCPTAVAGTPALAGPAGADGSGMPVGVQLHARRFADRWLAETARRDLSGAFAPPHPPGLDT